MAKVLSIGGLAWDRPVRLSRDIVPGARVLGLTEEGRLGGGAANTGVGLGHFGHDVSILSIIPEGEAGDQALRAARQAGPKTELVQRRGGQGMETYILIDPSGERTILFLYPKSDKDGLVDLMVHGGDYLSTPHLFEAAKALAPEIVFTSAWPGQVADYLALAKDWAVSQWPHGAGEACSLPAHVLIGSEDDLSRDCLERPFAHAKAIAGVGLRIAVVTRGERGATAYTEDGAVSVPSPPARIVDTTGAGDAFAAGFIHALSLGRDLKAALELGCAVGARAVETDSSQAPADISALV